MEGMVNFMMLRQSNTWNESDGEGVGKARHLAITDIKG